MPHDQDYYDLPRKPGAPVCYCWPSHRFDCPNYEKPEEDDKGRPAAGSDGYEGSDGQVWPTRPGFDPSYE
jgi:hypothetical protein